MWGAMEGGRRMKHQYRCDQCGCCLDPGEGHICDECREKSRRLSKIQKGMEAVIFEGIAGQYELMGGIKHGYKPV